MRFLLIAALLIFSPAITRADDIEDLIYATCRIRAEKSTGSGTIIDIVNDNEIVVLTAEHVVGPKGSKGRLQFCNDLKVPNLPYEVIKSDKSKDLALLKAKWSFTGSYWVMPKPIPIGNESVEKNQKIYSAGSPSGNWTNAFIGYVESESNQYTRIVPNIIPGRSGSSICSKGKIVGVVVKYTTIEEVALCVPLYQIKEFLKD